MKLKYIVVRVDDPFDLVNRGQEFAVVFPEALVHRQVARLHHVGQYVVVSAGFCSQDLVTGRWSAFGHSESLRMVSRPEDAGVLDRTFSVPDADRCSNGVVEPRNYPMH